MNKLGLVLRNAGLGFGVLHGSEILSHLMAFHQSLHGQRCRSNIYAQLLLVASEMKNSLRADLELQIRRGNMDNSEIIFLISPQKHTL